VKQAESGVQTLSQESERLADRIGVKASVVGRSDDRTAAGDDRCRPRPGAADRAVVGSVRQEEEEEEEEEEEGMRKRK
jgi:hypothetical protein